MGAILPSDLALLTSVAAYGVLHRSLTGSDPSLARLSAVIKAKSTLHSVVTTTLALYFLHKCRTQWANNGSLSTDEVSTKRGSRRTEAVFGGRNTDLQMYPDDSSNPLLQTRSMLGNAIAALECGYLLQDTTSLLHEARLVAHSVRPRSDLATRTILKFADKTLLFHHIGISVALLVLQYYTHYDRDRGIYIIVQFLLMNSSTPILNMRWWLRTYHPHRKTLCLASDLAFVAAFYTARVWLIGWILRGYGRSHGWDTALQVFREGMRVPCQMGTGALWMANTSWWSLLVLSVTKKISRELSLDSERTRG